MKAPIESMKKLRVGRGFRMPELPGTLLPARTILSTYYDTPDLVLLNAGITMRRCVGGGQEVWQLRTSARPTGGELARPARSLRPPEELTRLLLDRKSTRLNSSHSQQSRMPSSA